MDSWPYAINLGSNPPPFGPRSRCLLEALLPDALIVKRGIA